MVLMSADLIAAIGLAKEGLSLAEAVAGLLGLVESIDEKIDALTESELKAGILELDQAINSTSETQSLLRSARGHFNKAIHLEKGSKLCLAHLGLALCHRFLGDTANATRALEDLADKTWEIPTRSWIVAVAKDAGNPLVTYNPRWISKSFGVLYKSKLYTKEMYFGPSTKALVDDRERALRLSEIARQELVLFKGRGR